MKYQINWNPKTCEEYPYQLIAKKNIFGEWYLIRSYAKLEEAKTAADKLLENPLYEVSK